MQGEQARRAIVLEEREGEGVGPKGRPKTMGCSPRRSRLAVPAPEGLEVPDYASTEPGPPVDVPVRTFSPHSAKRRRTPPMRNRFDAETEQAIAYMHLAVVKAFDVERRDDSAKISSNVGAAWPFPVKFERSTDYAPGSVVMKPPRPSSAEIQFRDDVIDMMVDLAKQDRLGAKLVAGRALRTEWDVLQRHDPQQRKRWQLDKVRRAALKYLVDLDRERKRGILERLHRLFVVNLFPFAKHTDQA